MKYVIKAFFILPDKSLDCRFEFLLPDLDNTIEVLSRVSFEMYDVVKILPIE